MVLLPWCFTARSRGEGSSANWLRAVKGEGWEGLQEQGQGRCGQGEGGPGAAGQGEGEERLQTWRLQPADGRWREWRVQTSSQETEHWRWMRLVSLAEMDSCLASNIPPTFWRLWYDGIFYKFQYKEITDVNLQRVKIFCKIKIWIIDIYSIE